MKPKIKLVGGCVATVPDSAGSGQSPDSGNDERVLQPGVVAGSLLEPLLETVIRATGASAGIVRVMSPDGELLRTAGRAGMATETCQCERVVGVECGVCGKSATGKKVEAADAEYCRNRYGSSFFGAACNYVISTPLDDSENRLAPQGVMTLFFAEPVQVGAPLQDSLRAYAALVRIALQQIWQNEDRHQQSLLAERQAIANEIHDSLAQTLYFAKMRSSLLQEALKTKNDLLAYKCAQDVEESLASSQKTVRELVTHFRCQMDPRGLRFALERLVRDFTTRTGIRLEYENHMGDFRLPDDFELQVFLIVREAFVNIASHSGANMAKLSVWLDAGRVHVEVRDNGNGVSGEAPPEGHYGLAIMRERAVRIGGEVVVESLQAGGARVKLEFARPAA